MRLLLQSVHGRGVGSCELSRARIRPEPSSDLEEGGGSFDLKCGPMKTRQGNWGQSPENFEINAVLAV